MNMHRQYGLPVGAAVWKLIYETSMYWLTHYSPELFRTKNFTILLTTMLLVARSTNSMFFSIFFQFSFKKWVATYVATGI